jgi:hypothetical protein
MFTYLKVHELIGIKNNIVNLNQITNVSKELEEIVLSGDYDEFYEKVFLIIWNMYKILILNLRTCIQILVKFVQI